jgi:hypothetical protein
MREEKYSDPLYIPDTSAYSKYQLLLKGENTCEEDVTEFRFSIVDLANAAQIWKLSS